MDYFDLHCDTVAECDRTGQGFARNTLAVSLDRAARFSHYVQAFALFIPDTHRGAAARALYRRLLAVYRAQLRKNAARILPCRTGEDLLRARRAGKSAALLTVEGGAALGGRPEAVEELYRDGVRVMTLTWNGDNELACGQAGSGGGLTPLGREVLRRMRALGMLPDVSHLNARGVDEVCAAGGGPVLATHSCLSAVHPHGRNLSDRQFGLLCASGGLIGLNFYPAFLGGASGAFDAVYRHLSHALALGGEERLALGADFDGAQMAPELCRVDDAARLYEYLLARGVPEGTLRRVFYENAWDFFVRELRSADRQIPKSRENTLGTGGVPGREGEWQ